MYESDWVRLRSFELVVNEIRARDVPGSVAELGVFKGEFARYINQAFAEKTCYLFDTFEGFSAEEATLEKSVGHCTEAFITRFQDTSMENVLRIMPNPESIICKPGLFPKSLGDLEDTFCFVSIDVDFEQSIYDGLRYFYPRLNEGGYLFVHDYNSKTLKGVKKAVNRYEQEKGIWLSKMPIPDLDGTLIIAK